jgi:zinc protease
LNRSKAISRSATKRLSLLAGAMLALSCASFAQTTAKATPAATPTVDQVLDKYVDALGGRAAWKKITSRQSTGTIEIPTMNLSGAFQTFEKAPNQSLSVVVVAGANFRRGFDGKTGWSDDPENGILEQSGAELEETRRQADFYHSLDLRQLYKKLTLTGTEKIGDRDTYVIECATGTGDPDKMYFDTQTGLALRVTAQHYSPQGAEPVQDDLEDYRAVDGIKMAFTIHQTAGGNVITIRLAEVHHNLPIDNAQFSKPAAQ